MCFPGGNKASKEAKKQEDARQQQVASATAAIDKAYSGRDTQLTDFLNALRGEYTTDAYRQKDIADRKLKFSLARGGLTGGSAAADAGRQLGTEFTKGLLQSERMAQAGVSRLRSADAASRADLIRLAQGGADVSTAANQASEALRANLEGAKGESLVQGIGDIFGNTRSLYTQQEEAAARRRGLKEANIYADPFSRGTGSTG